MLNVFFKPSVPQRKTTDIIFYHDCISPVKKAHVFVCFLEVCIIGRDLRVDSCIPADIFLCVVRIVYTNCFIFLVGLHFVYLKF